MWNVQNATKKRGKHLLTKYLPRLSIISIQSFTPQLQPVRRLTKIENQWVVSVSGNIWETSRA